jgi:hypothetical protein
MEFNDGYDLYTLTEVQGPKWAHCMYRGCASAPVNLALYLVETPK